VHEQFGQPRPPLLVPVPHACADLVEDVEVVERMPVGDFRVYSMADLG
jgi:hypothetical protein